VLYAAYGSNMDPDQMSRRCPHSPTRGNGWLPGWRLTFGGEEFGWDGAQVFVALYEISPEDEAALDSWESADNGLYRKLRVRVETLDSAQVAWLYVLDAYEGGMPSATYLGALSEAAAAAGAPDDYVEDLRNRPCRSLGE
jgi:gamma-glutamylcyclotransferase (GGCT)/AIG2-like uncharacterized protein YtfP